MKKSELFSALAGLGDSTEVLIGVNGKNYSLGAGSFAQVGEGKAFLIQASPYGEGEDDSTQQENTEGVTIHKSDVLNNTSGISSAATGTNLTQQGQGYESTSAKSESQADGPKENLGNTGAVAGGSGSALPVEPQPTSPAPSTSPAPTTTQAPKKA